MTGEPRALAIRGLGASVGSRSIVRDVTFEARCGEIVAVIGPNGAGKTTLLETIVGLRPASTGTIHVHERELTRFQHFTSAFSFLSDVGTLPSEATVQTLVQHADARATAGLDTTSGLLDGLTLRPLLAKPVGILSRGEHQRVALYCALALGRAVSVLDEPFSAFDPLQLRNVLAAVRAVIGSRTTVVASIHQLADAERVADRILILADGKMVAFGDIASLRARVGEPDATLEDIFVSLLEGSNRAS
jgi:ABC-2 type transport system ATP-binding protein